MVLNHEPNDSREHRPDVTSGGRSTIERQELTAENERLRAELADRDATIIGLGSLVAKAHREGFVVADQKKR